MNLRKSVYPFGYWAIAISSLLFIAVGQALASSPGEDKFAIQQASSSGSMTADCDVAASGSPFIPLDSWIYPAALRLNALGFMDQVYLGLRPWTRASLSHMLEDTSNKLADADDSSVTREAKEIYDALNSELKLDAQDICQARSHTVNLESSYSVVRAISGTSLHDSFHLGSTIVNDYGRPYENGLNNYTGASGYATAGRFTVYLRGEFQGAPSATGYSAALFQTLAAVDQTVNPVTGLAYPNQATIPSGPLGTSTQGRFLEAYVSAQVFNHVISFGKQDDWLGPAMGASMAYSNNAENIYALHINRIEPLHVPLISSLTGPFRYEFLIGTLRGHTLMPNPLYANNPSAQQNVINSGDPWVHVEKVSFQPTENLEFGFERTAIFGGKGHSAVTLHTFLKSFFSLTAPSGAVKNSRDDPGARFGAFDFSYRLPYLRNWLTLYADSEAHDDVSPIDAPRHASIRPGLFLSHVPGAPKIDIRVEGISSDPPTSRSNGGSYVYWEQIEKQGYTNQGQIFGDWIGREDKGGQAWITYHLRGNEWVQTSFRHQKAAKDFIPGGTTLNDFNIQAVKRIGKDLEVTGNFTFEHWKAPIYLLGEQSVTVTTIQLTWFPGRGISF